MTYDAIIIGAGPAGLSAGIYLARFNRKTLIIDKDEGRSNTPGTYHNIMGFYEPVERKQLRALGSKQAKKYGAEELNDCVIQVKKLNEGNFEIYTEKNNYYNAKNLIFCTGVTDNWPQIEGYEEYLGYTLHSCPVCFGYETTNKRVIIVGTNRSDGLALELLNYTDKLTIITQGEPFEVRDEYVKKLNKKNIPVYRNKAVKLTGSNHQIEKVVLDDGRKLEADIIYSACGVQTKSELAKNIGANLNKHGYIIVNGHQETNIKGAYAAGDISSFDSKQVVTAMYEGYMAALSIHKKMLKEEISRI